MIEQWRCQRILVKCRNWAVFGRSGRDGRAPPDFDTRPSSRSTPCSGAPREAPRPVITWTQACDVTLLYYVVSYINRNAHKFLTLHLLTNSYCITVIKHSNNWPKILLTATMYEKYRRWFSSLSRVQNHIISWLW